MEDKKDWTGCIVRLSDQINGDHDSLAIVLKEDRKHHIKMTWIYGNAIKVFKTYNLPKIFSQHKSNFRIIDEF